ncbi:cell envelope-related function transcriptional attenuator common domain-containing protein [Streptomyces sp. 3213]|uniref:LCP family protein n=1 Tax=Streptomyces sp. 3213.3 TaxID=1855348 RepID=UPI0008994D96|nr:LCP family protein [Streptomyces sp. 3213.3]SEC79040.1 cell envelope-related function transcriptional attenuator common domain-containing protein [Streptomyces sp. 3213] [Streptomyces sp. 3213.3]
MSDPRGERSGRAATRDRSGMPRPRRADEGSAHQPPVGRAAARQAARSGGHRSRRRAKPVARRRKVARIALITVSALILVTAGVGTWLWQHLNGNINSVALDDGAGGKEKADAFGRTPINLLVIGSDGRNNAADCKLGGGCGSGTSTVGHNADVEMVVHVSADRSNATVMSVPRDTMTQVPACKDPDSSQATAGYYGQINSALQYGPACQVKTVHQLTGITIDHFVMLDFAGVVKMSDAVGGVSVCVSDNVYDTYSHLKLAKGTHTLKGTAALEFVRSRHGFGDGSDLGRTVSQHLFLSAMIRKFKSAGTLANPAKVYSLADAATKALTVDTGLGSVGKLVDLATDLDKVPSKRMTFTTMQTGADPANADRVVPAAAAKSLFAAIANDQSLSSGSGKKKASSSPSTTAPATVPAAEVAVKVENGTTIGGRASVIANALITKGFSPGTSTGNAPEQAATTQLTYGPGEKDEAQTVASALGLSAAHLTQSSASGLTLVIGADWPTGTTLSGGSSSAAPADTHAAVSNANASTADQSKTCAKVSPYKTVSLNGVPMTPAQAYAAASGRKDSAS